MIHLRFDVLPSTNGYAKSGECAQVPRPFAVSARVQTAGRGQRGNVWASEAGANLLLSYVCRPLVPAQQQFCLSEAAALGVLDFCASVGIGARVKWPNDIFVERRKLAGILIDNTVRGALVAETVVGVGFNLNQLTFGVTAGRPISAARVLGRELGYEGCLQNLLDALEERFAQVAHSNLRASYLAQMYALGQSHRFQLPDGLLFEGTIVGLDPLGRLLVNMPDGIKRAFAFNEIAYIFAD